MAEPERLLSIDEVAERLGYSPATVADKLRAGELPGFHVGRLWRVREAALDKLVRELAEAGEAEQAERQRKAKAKAKARVQKRAGAA